MAQEQGVIQLPGVGIPRSLSDRPLPVRMLVHFGRFMTTKPLGGVGVVVILLVILMAVFAPFVSRYDPEAVSTTSSPECGTTELEALKTATGCYSPLLIEMADSNPIVRLTYSSELFQKGEVIQTIASPSSAHWLGTDKVGRDLWSRIIYGSRLALLVGVGAALIAVIIGTTLGVVSAYFGGLVDMVLQRLTDAFFAFPALILLLLFSQVVEDPNKYFNTVALGIVGIASVTRIARSAVLSTREEVYVLAARTVGASDPRIMARHILPNIMAPLIVIFTTSIGVYILAEASLAFIGLGDPVAVSWGKMVNEARQLGPAKPLMALFVGSALTVTVLGFNLAGDALRDVLDPRLRGRGGRAGF
ncbi:MAG: ABC transporter permease [Chloroflexi bacterium]|nr:ABC transporter permease [Chloroflexota bacterium]